MICYDPLVETLKKKGVTIFKLQDLTKNRNLKVVLNTGRYIDGRTVDKICTILDCKVEDVMEYKPGEQPIKPIIRNRFYEVNEKYVLELCKERGLTPTEASNAMNRSDSYLKDSLGKKRLGYRAVKVLCDFFDKTPAELCAKDIEKEV